MTVRWTAGTAGLLACLSLAPMGRAQEGATAESSPEAPPPATEDARTDPEPSGTDPDDAMEGASPRTPPYAVKTQRGMRQVLARDLDGAVGSLREAIQVDPRRPQAHYYLGVARSMQGELQDAIASLETAARMAEDDVAWKVRALVAVAWTAERIAAERPEADDADPNAPRINEPHLGRARDAWQRVRDLVDNTDDHPLLATATSVAVERQRAIDEVLATEERTVPVRQRIAERERQKAEDDASDE